MNQRFARRSLLILTITCLWLLSGACGVAAGAGFQPALPGYRYQFPRDHAAHPAHQTEWWYYTGHLQSAAGRRFGYELTFFRHALLPQLKNRPSKWAIRDLILAHFAITDETGRRFYYTDRASRTALGLAGADTINVDTTKLAKLPSAKLPSAKLPRIWLGRWTLRFAGRGGEVQMLRAEGSSNSTEFAIELTQRALKPPVIHGQNGISQKAAGRGHASHYYSFTRLATTGTLRLGSTRHAVSGQSWFDHEFGSGQLGKGQTGWDWFSIQLADGRELMLYQLRLDNGGIDPFSSGTLVERDGRTRHLGRSEFRIEPLASWRSPHSKALYPARWRVTLPRENVQLEIIPTLADQELNTKRSTQISYWEGSVGVTGTQRGRVLRGVGYVELTGYARPFAKGAL
ncbi:MAG TPA: lipocalin-like domain-containing protein [Abditibacteriaceae bacterium]|nr:lipocalin-like domain-containing protein [Abditibacteriaceae bacterium]